MSFWVYILRCSDGSYYVGHTDKLEQRLAQHNQGAIPGYTRTRRPVTLAYSDRFLTRLEAMDAERQLKGWSRAKKEALISGRTTRLKALSHLPLRKPPGPQATPGTPPSRQRIAPGVLPAGKLPQEMLASLLAKVAHRDPRVLIGPGIGRDAAVIDTGAPKLLVAKSDPITFATDLIGSYAVHVNANDIACMGGRPTWFLATALLPEGCPRTLPGEILSQLTAACDALDIELVGGHTEVTYGLDRPIIVGAMLGEVEPERLVRPENARPGDAVILTKGIAIEGTAVLAREAAADLREAGLPDRTLERATAYIANPGISVVAEASAACEAGAVHAMHDPTEGGLATALRELAGVTRCGLLIHHDAIRVFPETAAVCAALALDPLGLLASGALLIAVSEDDTSNVIASIKHAGVSAVRIGSLVDAAQGAIMMVNGKPTPLPAFGRDEVARYFSGTVG
jgi:hydrogenase expression/formation protein HypE